MQLAISNAWEDSISRTVVGAYAALSLQPLERRHGKLKVLNSSPCVAPAHKKARQVTWEKQAWSLDPGTRRLEICGDSRVIVNWCNGVWPVKFTPYARCVSELQRDLHHLAKTAKVRPREDCADFCRHIFRELNQEADAMANRHGSSCHVKEYGEPAACVRAFFDGSVKGKRAAFGWVVQECSAGDQDMSKWRTVATKSGSLPDGASITAAELEACSSLVSFLSSYYKSYEEALGRITMDRLMNYNSIRVLFLAELV